MSIQAVLSGLVFALGIAILGSHDLVPEMDTRIGQRRPAILIECGGPIPFLFEGSR